jgi:hypothetical protein
MIATWQYYMLDTAPSAAELTRSTLRPQLETVAAVERQNLWPLPLWLERGPSGRRKYRARVVGGIPTL